MWIAVIDICKREMKERMSHFQILILVVSDKSLIQRDQTQL